MTDLNDRIAARRAELARAEQQAGADAKADAEAQRDAERRRQAATAQRVAEDLSAELNGLKGVETVSRDGEVQLVHEPDLTGYSPEMRQDALERLIRREMRQLWTPLEQWAIISLVAAGVCLIPLGGFGLLLIAAGALLRNHVNKRCRLHLRSEHPELFHLLDAPQPTPAGAPPAPDETLAGRMGWDFTETDRK